MIGTDINTLLSLKQEHDSVSALLQQRIDLLHERDNTSMLHDWEKIVKDMNDNPERYASITRRVRSLGYAWKHATHGDDLPLTCADISTYGTLRQVYHAQKDVRRINGSTFLKQAFFYSGRKIEFAMSGTNEVSYDIGRLFGNLLYKHTDSLELKLL